MNILVTGGAGYVGSVVSGQLAKQGHEVLVLDNLQQGHHPTIDEDPVFLWFDIDEVDVLEDILVHCRIDAVVHMAAETVIEHSLTDPGRYFKINIIDGIRLLDTMVKSNVKKIIFSSSASIYGEPESSLIEEDHPKNPVNSYGETKLMFENILKWYGYAYGLKHISLRYFNTAGASGNHGEDHRPETHLIPNVLNTAIYPDKPVAVFGIDYPTRDGSCIRDFVHVADIARAHILALEKLDEFSGRAYNLGSGKGYSVLEVIDIAREVTGVDIPVEIRPRRVGDPAMLVADITRARVELGWKTEYSTLKEIIESAWKWIKEHPDGYEF
ncbi:MAG TPA: UDP-glucose 4-epimerase GalE [Dehalococcoidia bacterium]|nr:UDP-glucose 4-epimerase GalE [Dehalococcoidia bacterium]